MLNSMTCPDIIGKSRNAGKTFLQISFFFLFITQMCFGQWQPDVRLTNDPAYSWTSYNNAWCIASSGSVVHVVWFDLRDGGNSEIYYKRSTDAGESWGADTRLTNNADMSRFPSVAVSGSVVHVVWEDTRDWYTQIYYKRSTDGGISWGTDIRLTNINATSAEACVKVFGSVVHVVWTDDRDGNYEIYYKRSTDGGVSWDADTRLTDNIAQSWSPSVTVSGSLVHVVWTDRRDRDGYPEVYYKRSTDSGISWGTDTRLTNNTYIFSSFEPSISSSGSFVFVLYTDNRDGNNEIYCERSIDGGANWDSEIRLTNDVGFSNSSSVFVSDLIVHVVWTDTRNADHEIYYKRSQDAGESWQEDTRLTNATDLSWFPSVTVSDSIVHVVWKDLRDGNWEIYYKRNPTGNVTRLENNDLNIPMEFSLFQNYPNPFNPSTKISWQSPISGWQTLKVYDVLGNEVATLVDEYKPAGNYEVEFRPNRHSRESGNLSSGVSARGGYTSGVYFYQLKAGSFIQTKKMILMK